AMAREGIRFDLGNAFQKAIREKGEVVVRGLKLKGEDAGHAVDVTVRVIEEPEALQGMAMIIFADVAVPAGRKPAGRSRNAPADAARVAELEQELTQTREALQTIREEMQSSQEELRSANEELQSTNEELQSTNEELTTSREEMQSLNEELQTVNAEQQARLDELSRTSNDMKNLLDSTEIVTVFLDRELRIRRFTAGADRLFKLLPGDVGRPLSDIANDLLYPGMTGEVEEVLRTLASSEKEIAATDGRWFSVRIMPYRTMEDVIGGVVITFADITRFKQAETALTGENARLKRRLEGKRR
ncbi:MAG TPA: PAS domain-containing protein, partial [Candidatus Deferrimicrobiaceae bacterium]